MLACDNGNLQMVRYLIENKTRPFIDIHNKGKVSSTNYLDVFYLYIEFTLN